MIEERGDSTVVFGLLGFLYFVAVGTLAIGLAGGGHGWNAAIVSGVGSVFIPVFGITLASPRNERRGALVAIASAMLVADVLLIVVTWAEGAAYFRRVWASSPGGVALWSILWSAWQFAVAGVLVNDLVRARRR